MESTAAVGESEDRENSKIYMLPCRYLPMDYMIEVLYEAALGVEKALRELKEPFGLRVADGADGTPTAIIDRVAEDAIIQVMEEHNLSFKMLSEEGGFIRVGWEETDEWLIVDPIDGSFNAIHGFPYFSVSLAIAEKDLNGVSHALVRNLVNGEAYYAVKGSGAYFIPSNDTCDSEVPARVRSFDPSMSLFFAYLGSHASRRSFDIARIPRRIRSFGSASLEMCEVAVGRADAYMLECDPPTSRIRVVDIAASQLILKEAGGEVFDMETLEPLNLPLNLDVRKNVIAVGDRKVMEWVRSRVLEAE